MEPKGSLLSSQEPATDPYLKLDESIPHLSTLFTQDPFWYYPPIYT
jgi:hypothetical protein